MNIEEILEREKVKKNFLIDIIKYVPENSFWGIQGIYEKDTIERIKPFIENIEVKDSEIFPDFVIKLSSNVKKEIEKIILDSNIVNDIIEHQFIKYEDITYFKSFDGLSNNIISDNLFPQERFEIYKHLKLL